MHVKFLKVQNKISTCLEINRKVLLQKNQILAFILLLSVGLHWNVLRNFYCKPSMYLDYCMFQIYDDLE